MLLASSKLGSSIIFSPSESEHRHASNHPRHRVAVKSHRRSVSASLVEKEKALDNFTEPEARLIEGVLGLQGRGRSATSKQLKELERAVEALEELGGVPNPTASDLIEGRWQLIFTTRPGTSSPIQRTFVGVDNFKVFQEICLKKGPSRVSNIVQFSEAIGELKVEAEASTEDGKRILFRFDRAAFSFKFLPFKVPYPVPFRLLGDEAKGWLDTTYLSGTGNMRISKGNKGTTFILQKKIEHRQKLLSAIAVGIGTSEAVEEFITTNQGVNQELELAQGRWQLIWVSQFETENWFETAAKGYKGLQIVMENCQLENLISSFPGFLISTKGRIMKTPSNNYSVIMNEGSIIIGPLRLPLSVKSKFELKLLYVDSKIRITQNDKQVIFVHLFVGES